MSSALDLGTASEELGVHYQTAYRWVRSGRLDATLVNGRYRVERGEVDRLARERNRPSPAPQRSPRGGFGRFAARSEELLLAGREREFRHLVADLSGSGVAISRVITEVISPALREIGARWSAGNLDIATEHRASAIVERVLGEHMPTPRGRRRGTAVVAAPEGDLHSLPTSMAAAALREDNWRVQHLGANMPSTEVEAFCRREDPDLVVLTCTAPDARQVAEELASAIGAEGPPVLVGGAGQSLTDLVEAARDAVTASRRHPAHPVVSGAGG
jgi:excisionase family DNA binding protein